MNTTVPSDFPVGARVRLNPAGAGKFAPKRWMEREGTVIGHACRSSLHQFATILLVVWDGCTRRRIERKHHSHFVRVG